MLFKDWIRDMQKHVIRYDTLGSIPVEEFEDKSVLVLGEGNAAAETTDAIRNYARDMVSVSRTNGVRLMRDTRYVGNLRGRRTTYVDANAFKSYEGQSSMDLDESWLVMVACGKKGRGVPHPGSHGYQVGPNMSGVLTLRSSHYGDLN